MLFTYYARKMVFTLLPFHLAPLPGSLAFVVVAVFVIMNPHYFNLMWSRKKVSKLFLPCLTLPLGKIKKENCIPYYEQGETHNNNKNGYNEPSTYAIWWCWWAAVFLVVFFGSKWILSPSRKFPIFEHVHQNKMKWEGRKQALRKWSAWW